MRSLLLQIVMDLHNLLLAGLPAHSGLPRISDIVRSVRQVGFVPITDYGDHFSAALLMITRARKHGNVYGEGIDPSDQLGFMPFDLMIATAADPLR
jgi:hypothetical protein